METDRTIYTNETITIETTENTCGEKTNDETTARTNLLALSTCPVVEKINQNSIVLLDWSEVGHGWKNAAPTEINFLSRDPNDNKKIRKMQKVSRRYMRGITDSLKYPRTFSNLMNLSDKNIKALESIDKFSLWKGITDSDSNRYVDRNGVYSKLKFCQQSPELGKLLGTKRSNDRIPLSPQQRLLQKEIQRDLKKEFENSKLADTSDNNTTRIDHLNIDNLNNGTENKNWVSPVDQKEQLNQFVRNISPYNVKQPSSRILTTPGDINRILTPHSLPSMFPLRLYPSSTDGNLTFEQQISIYDHELRLDRKMLKRELRSGDLRSKRMQNYVSTLGSHPTLTVKPIRTMEKEKVLRTKNEIFHKQNRNTNNNLHLPIETIESLKISSKQYRTSLRPPKLKVISPIATNSDKHEQSNMDIQNGIDLRTSEDKSLPHADLNNGREMLDSEGDSSSFGHFSYLPEISGKQLTISTMRAT